MIDPAEILIIQEIQQFMLENNEVSEMDQPVFYSGTPAQKQQAKEIRNKYIALDRKTSQLVVAVRCDPVWWISCRFLLFEDPDRFEKLTRKIIFRRGGIEQTATYFRNYVRAQ